MLNTVLWTLVRKISCTVENFNPLLKWVNSFYDFITTTTKTTKQYCKFFSETTTNKTQWAWGGAGFIPMTFALSIHVQSCHYGCLKTDFSTGLTVTSLSSDFVINRQKKLGITSPLKYSSYEKIIAYFPTIFVFMKQWPRSRNGFATEIPWIWWFFLHSICYVFEQHMRLGSGEKFKSHIGELSQIIAVLATYFSFFSVISNHALQNICFACHLLKHSLKNQAENILKVIKTRNTFGLLYLRNVLTFFSCSF